MNTFAAIQDQGINFDFKKMAIFISICLLRCRNITGCSNPMMSIFLIEYGSLVGNQEESSLSSFKHINFSTSMTKEMKNYSSTNNSSANVTLDSEKTVSIKKFIIEMNAKNKAYFFILSNGLLEQFSEFCKNYHSSNPHRDCLNYLL